MKVLIIVDVQNCFIMKGSLGIEAADMSMMKEIESLVKEGKYDMIVFTRDSHPPNHTSFTIYPDHCRDVSKPRCPKDIAKKDPTIKDQLQTPKTVGQLINISDPNISNKPVIGTNLSYLYYLTDIHQLVFTPHYEIKKMDHDNSILDNSVAKRSINRTSVHNIHGQPTIVHLLKGEYCDADAYSAFNYHIKYDPITNAEIELPTCLTYSTGLAEIIFDNLNKSNDKSCINIDICGLAGNICVMHTFVHGLALFKQILTKKSCESPHVILNNKSFSFIGCDPANLSVKLNYLYLKGTRFLPIPGVLGNFKNMKLQPSEETSDFIIDYLNDEMNKNDELKGLTLTKEKNQGDGAISVNIDQTILDILPTIVIERSMYNPLVPVTEPINLYYPVYVDNKKRYNRLQ